MLSLVLFRTPMDLYAMFGLFMLVGIVKKNGILQVDATNQLRARGLARYQAILEANHTRLRPILMTTVMLVAAMVPIALGQGPGAGARASMAKVIIGGQVLSLILALVVTPVFYTLLDMLSNLSCRLGLGLGVDATPHPRGRRRLHHRPGREQEEVDLGRETAEHSVT
jgi:HAE1 family hydrophobic/amphiphilic exporter-1